MFDPETLESFKRRIERYRDAINSDEHVVFITNNNKKDMVENGLQDYYNDRKAKTSIVYLNEVFTKENYAKISELGKVSKITFGYESGIGIEGRTDSMCKVICDLIVEVSKSK